jgi:hypothetical protein
VNKTEYIGKLNALYVGEKNCLEELITIYDEKDKEIERLNNKNEELLSLYTTEREVKDDYKTIINELEKWLKERLEKLDIYGYDDDVFNGIELVLQKLKELKGENNV